MKRQARFKKKIVLGLTGSFGSGKTAVAKILRSYGAKIIDADRVVHQLLKPKTKIYKKIINTFGSDILRQDKSLNRSKIAGIVFKNKKFLGLLNKIIHPQVIKIIKNKIKASPAKVTVVDAPLLIEAGLKNLVDKLIVVKIKRKQQIERLLRKTSLCKSDILKRIQYQLPLRKKIRLADFVIDNSGSIKKTKKQIKGFFQEINKSK